VTYILKFSTQIVFLLKNLLALVTTHDFASIHVRCEFPNIKWKLIPKWKISLWPPKILHICTHVTILSKNSMAQKSCQINIICKCGEFSKNPSKIFDVRWCHVSHHISCHYFFLLMSHMSHHIMTSNDMMTCSTMGINLFEIFWQNFIYGHQITIQL
jgi:hypothetical protein